MAVTQNLKGTSYPSFKIHKSGATLYQGNVAPSFTASHGDLYLQHGTDGALWLYKDNAWSQLGAGGISTDTTIINNSTNTGSHVKQYVLFGETNDGNEHILAPTSAFSIDTTTTTIDDITTSIDTGTVSGVIPVPLNSANLFEVRVVARSANPNNNAGYTLKGVIVNDAGTTTLINDATENILAESTSEWYSIVEANDNGDDSFVIKVSGSANTTVRWTAFVTLTSVATPQYTLSSDTTAVNEGDSVTFTLTTTHISDGTTIAYTITGIDQADLAVGNLTGTFNITNNTGTQTFTLANDATTEGTENMTLALDNGLASADVVVVTDTSLDPTYTLSADNTTINEGDTVTITLTTTDITDGTELAYTVTGVDADDLSAGSLTGNFTINNNTGTAVFTLAEDESTEGDETLTLTLDNGEGSIAITITDTSLNAPSTPEGYLTPLTLTPTSNGGTTTKFVGADDYSVSANDRYAIVTEANASVYDGSTYVKQAGWCYLFDLVSGNVLKSWNPLLDGDHNDDGSLDAWTPGGSFTQPSKYHTALVGRSTAINNDYAFISATFSGYMQTAGAYIFVYKLSDYSIAKVFRLADIPNVLPDDGNGASSNTDFGHYGIHATENWLVVGAPRVSTPGGSTNDPATSEQEGAIFIYDISDADPANWSFAKHLENPVPNSARTTGPSGWWGSFGYINHVSESGNYLYTTGRSRSYKYNLTNGTWASNPVTMWSADPHSNTNYNPTDLSDVYFDQDHSKLDGNIIYYADTSGDEVKAYNLDTETLLWTQTYDTPRSVDLSDDHVFVQAVDGTQKKVYVLNKTDGTLAKTFTSPNHGTGVDQFGAHFGVTSGGILIASEMDTNNEFSYMMLFRPTYINNYVYPGYWEPGYVINPVVSSAVWYGDRGIISGYLQNKMEYIDITTPGNSSSFGELTTNRNQPGSVSNASRAVIAGGSVQPAIGNMDYIATATLGNAQSFGDLSNTVYDYCSGASNGITGLFAGPDGSGGDIDYITIDTTGNAQSFGELTNLNYYTAGSGMDANYALWAGGINSALTSQIRSIDYVTIATPGNATLFGLLTVARAYIGSSISDDTRTVFAGGASGTGNFYTANNTIDYVTTATASDATNFGDLTVARGYSAGSNNATRAFVVGGWDGTYNAGQTNIIDYFEIQTPSNATDFGDLSSNDTDISGCSGNAS